ncbi:hypothetical protein D3C80_1619180 [compost metagenome]
MPGTAVFIDQLINGRRRITHQVVTADLTVGQQLQGALQVSVGVVQHDELDASVLVDRRVATVDPQATATTCQGQQQENSNKGFHGEGHM